MGWTGCTKKEPPPPPPPAVVVAPVAVRDVPIWGEWIGTTAGDVNAEIRPKVEGYLLRRAYAEGSFVRRGELLFEIDPRQFQAQVAQAQANLGQVEAALAKAERDVARYRPLAAERALSQQELDNAISAEQVARANVAALQAALQQARLNLAWTRVTSPIGGIAGTAQAQVGNLLNPQSVLATVSRVDPIRVIWNVSEQEFLRFEEQQQARREATPLPSGRDAARRGAAQGSRTGSLTGSAEGSRPSNLIGGAGSLPGSVTGGAGSPPSGLIGGAGSLPSALELVLADGSVFPRPGKVIFADRQVDVKTGTIGIVGLFPNPGNLLRPGQYAKVRAVTRIEKRALLVPQRAVNELQGAYQVAVIGIDNRADIRTVQTGPRTGSSWIIQRGLQAGERVVVEGYSRVKAGALVRPREAVPEAATPRPPSPTPSGS